MKVKDLIKNLQGMNPEEHVAAAIWTVEDVKEQAPGISDEDCAEVLNYLDRNWDANEGISYESLRGTIQLFYPDQELKEEDED